MHLLVIPRSLKISTANHLQEDRKVMTLPNMAEVAQALVTMSQSRAPFRSMMYESFAASLLTLLRVLTTKSLPLLCLFVQSHVPMYTQRLVEMRQEMDAITQVSECFRPCVLSVHRKMQIPNTC